MLGFLERARELLPGSSKQEVGITTRNLEKFVRDVCRIPSPAPTPEQFNEN